MSLKFIAELSCDSCGKTIREEHNKSTELGRAYWRVKSNAEKSGWVVLQRGGMPKHFCNKCAETVPAKKFTRFTAEELATRRVSRARGKHMRETLKKETYWSEELFQQDKWKYGLGPSDGD